MSCARDIFRALRIAAVWLLVMSVLFGPVGLGASSGLAAASSCGSSCPCDEALHDSHIEHDDGASCSGEDEQGNHDESAPCEDQCPDDCPNCGCRVGVAMAVLPYAVPSHVALCSSALVLAPVDIPASVARTGIFRPPRALS